MKRYVSRWTAIALVLVVGLAVCAPPALADTASSTPHKASLTTLSPASMTLLRSHAEATERAAQASTPSDTSFFKTRRGAAVLALMAAGVAFTVWSARHDREPVKSPIR